MALDKEARAVLFGTPMLAHQIRKCVQGKGSMPESELRSIFSDINKSVFDHAVWKLVNRGVLARKDGEISFCPDAPAIRGNQADRAWKAACLLKSFRLEELCRTADIKWTYAQRLMARWVSKGLAVKNGTSCRGSFAVWTMKPADPNNRPVNRRK